MYVVKDHDERKTEFLDTAMGLFMQHGYDQTSVNAIIEAVGVSKGAFYHYFKSKEELLDAIAARASEQALSTVDAVVNDSEMDAITKLNEVFARTNSFKAQNRELIIAIAKVFYSDSNVLLRSRLTERSISAFSPIIAAIIRQGVDEGIMEVEHPEETARFVMQIGANVVSEFAKPLTNAKNDPEAVEKILTIMNVYTTSIERILGIPEGSLELVDASMMKVIKGEAND
ncbi:MAG: TetR/AcrR family transcriptional regulator [Spirochaetales bacterium]